MTHTTHTMTPTPARELAGKVAFVTGAASGIGRATAIAFARAGANVCIADISEAQLEVTAAAIEPLGVQVLPVRCDVSRAADVEAALDQTVAAFGGLDLAFNNAGVEQPVTTLADLSEELWDRVIAVNLKSVFLCMKYEIPLMLARGGGAIVNTSSGAGVLAIRGQAGYCASKFGVVAMSKVAALDYAARQVRVNAICPGIIDTPMMDRFAGDTAEGRARVIAQEPIGRMGRPEEIAGAVLWLCSERAGFVTGHALVMDGGQTAGI